MSFIGLDFESPLGGCSACAMVGNGRKAREVWKEPLRFGAARCAGALDALEESARGEETRGRDMDMGADAGTEEG